MADIEYTGDVYTQIMGQQEVPPTAHAPEPAPSPVQGVASILGALASLGLVVGIGVWGYQLIMRDVSGVPVVRALEGPMRVQPDDPGGVQAAHQGLAVNAVAADGAAAPTAERLVLAPRPVTLLAEDAPIGQIKVQPAPLEPSSTTGTPSDQTLETASVDALVEQLTAGVAPISGEESPINPAHRAADEINEAPQPEALASDNNTQPAAYETALNASGPTRSLRPQARPARAVVSGGTSSDPAALASAINSAVDTVASIEIDPDTLAVGTRLAQLGAYDSPEIARSEWQKLSVRFEDFMDGKQRVIQKASSGGRTFYRLRALGFTDLSDARRFCSALVSENTDCIPVTVR
jgi:SPOR domain